MQQISSQVVSPFYTSSSQFGVCFENNFVFTDDGRHLIGVDGTNYNCVRVEDITTGSSFSFGYHNDFIFTLIFDQDSGTLLAGEWDKYLIQYDLDLVNKKFREVRDFGDLGIGYVYSSFRFMQYVFFGGSNYKLKVFDLSSKEMLPGHIKTGVRDIYSLQVCAIDKSRIFLAVLGLNYKYSSNKSDLYDLSDLMKSVTIPKELTNPLKYVSVSDLKSKEAEFLNAIKTISQQEDRIHKLRQKNKSIPVLENKLKRLEQKLTQKQSQHQSLLNEHQTLQNKHNQLKKNISSQEDTVKLLLKTNEDLNKKLSKAKSKKSQSRNLRQDLLDQTKSFKSRLLQQKRKSDAKVHGLLKKLSVLNYMRKEQVASSKGRKNKGTHQQDFAERIRGLEDRLGVKKTECKNIRDTLTDTLNQNKKYEERIQSKIKKIKTLTHRLTNTEAACSEG